MLRKNRLFGFAAAGVAVASLGLAQTAQAAPTTISFDPDGGADGFIEVAALDHKPGNALAEGANTAVANFISGVGPTTFNTYYQAKITQLLDSASNPIVVPGLNSAFELTAVAGFTERVVGAGAFPSATTFELAANPTVNFFEIYYDAANNSDDLAGTGFNDGTLILSAELTRINSVFTPFGGGAGTPLDGFGGDSYPAIDSVLGAGSSQLVADVTFTNAGFFAGPPATLLFTIFNTFQNLNFTQTNPSAMFAKAPGGVAPVLAGAGLGVASLGTVNGSAPGSATAGPDVQFQADATQSFTVVPEPATASLGLIGLGALAFLRRRR